MCIKEPRNLNKEYAELHDSLSIGIKNLDVKDSVRIDSIVEVIRCNQLLIIQRQADLINDIRQETNNSIDKLNLWNAFAIGLMAIIGVFIPLAIQFRNQNESDKKIKETLGTYKSEFDSFRKNFSEIETKAQILENSIKKNFESEIEKNQKLIAILKMKSRFMSLNMEHNCKILSNQPDRVRFYRFLWNRAVDSLKIVVDDCFSDAFSDNEKRMYLIESFMLIDSFIMKLMTCVLTGGFRKWDNISDDIRYLLLELEYGWENGIAWSIIKNDVDNIIEKIVRLRIPD